MVTFDCILDLAIAYLDNNSIKEANRAIQDKMSPDIMCHTIARRLLRLLDALPLLWFHRIYLNFIEFHIIRWEVICLVCNGGNNCFQCGAAIINTINGPPNPPRYDEESWNKDSTIENGILSSPASHLVTLAFALKLLYEDTSMAGILWFLLAEEKFFII